MITGFVGQGRFHSIDKWGFILFSKNSPDDLKVFVGRQKEKFLWEGKDGGGGGGGGGGKAKLKFFLGRKIYAPPPPPHCYLLSNELIMYIGLY